MSTKNQVLNWIIHILDQHKDELKNNKVYLFGSRDRQIQKPFSDFDIAIQGKEAIQLKLFYQIEDGLENLPTLYKIDLVDLNRTSKSFREHALKQSNCIYG